MASAAQLATPTLREPTVSDELTPDIAPQVLAACTENAEEAAGALGRALDGEFVLKPGEAGDASRVDLSGGGLVVSLAFGSAGLLVVLPESSGLLPDWVLSPDPTGESKLSTLGQELGMLVVPESLFSDAQTAGWVDDLAACVARCEPADGAAALPIEVAAGETLGVMTLVWPVAKPTAALVAEDSPTVDAAEPTNGSADTASEGAGSSSPSQPVGPADGRARVLRWNGPPPRDYRDLPPHTVSQLRVMVPVSASLAIKKAKIEEIVELGPGSIITFDTACDDPLTIAVGERAVATADAVKVGDKFGVRVREMISPPERFRPMLPPQAD
ncbi:MAG: FliM/FliN family flagellar motor switch protein [Planctomycetota bacterium]